jgi:cell division protein FtsB
MTRGLSVGRLVAVVVLAVIAALYVGPVQKYLHVRRDLANQRAQVATLEREHGRLTRLEQSLHSRATIVWYARRCGWVFPGETPIVVQGVGGSDCE